MNHARSWGVHVEALCFHFTQRTNSWLNTLTSSTSVRTSRTSKRTGDVSDAFSHFKPTFLKSPRFLRFNYNRPFPVLYQVVVRVYCCQFSLTCISRCAVDSVPPAVLAMTSGLMWKCPQCDGINVKSLFCGNWDTASSQLQIRGFIQAVISLSLEPAAVTIWGGGRSMLSDRQTLWLLE